MTTQAKARHVSASPGKHVARGRGGKVGLATFIAVLSTIAAVAVALWLASGSGGSNSQAQTVGAGNTPTAVVADSSVDLSWAESTLLPGGQAVDGYIVSRYDDGGAPQVVGPGCDGVVPGLSCVETGVPNGSWHYTVTPVVGTAWRGLESPSTPVIVAVPAVISVTPNVRGQGFTGTVVLTGTDFVDGASVSFSGTGITVDNVTFDGPTQLIVEISIPSDASTGPLDVTVTNPDGGTGTCTGCFTVTPGPTVTSATPNTRGQGFTGSVILTGTNFVDGATVSFSGNGITVNGVTFDSSTQLTLSITVASGATPGPRTVTVTNPDGGNGACTGCLIVTPGPTVTSATPNTRGQGFTGNVILTGTEFADGAAVSFSGTGVTVNTVTFNSPTQLTVNISIASTATTGARNITVTNPDSGLGACVGCLTVNPGPTVTSATPNTRGQGFSGNVVLAGTNFVDGATVAFSGTGITINTVTFNSPTQLTVNFTVGSAAGPGPRDVTVTNPDSGAGTCTGCFTVNPGPTVTSLNPDFGLPNTTYPTVTITGTGFASGATVAFSGTGITVNSVTFNSPTQLTISITTTGAGLGARNITVTNPDGGIGACTGCYTVVTGPTITSVTPSTRGQGSTGQTLVITGTFFRPGATVPNPGSGVTVTSTTVNSSTQITITVNILQGAAVGARAITVNNPTGFGSATCATCFSVTARPGTFSLAPNTRGQGATNQNIVITGTLFQSGATVTFSGTGITVNSVTFNSATQLTVNISIAPTATTGARSVTITNPDAGFRTMNAFTVAAAPNPTTVTPGSRPQAFTGTVSITGSGFVNGATVAISGTGITVNSVTFNNATRITANLTVAADATLGSRDITVTNPNAGTRTCLGCLTVTANPTATSLTPPTRARGTAGIHTIEGTGFVSGASVVVSGGGVTPSNVIVNSATQITVTLTVTPGALLGPRNVTVTNLDSGTGTCAGCLTVS